MIPDTPSCHLDDVPLWRLLVMLDDSERCDGPDSPTSQMLVHVIRERLLRERPGPAEIEASSPGSLNPCADAAPTPRRRRR